MICECGDHAWKAVNLGFVVLVSPEDEDLLDRHNWHACRDGRNYLMVRRNLSDYATGMRKRLQERLSRRIVSPMGPEIVDHRNLNSLDNRRPNLRVCSNAQNMLNRRPRPGKAVPFKGVRRGSGGRFEALIKKNKRQYYLGSFETAEEAHAAYCRAAERLHGEFARAA